MFFTLRISETMWNSAVLRISQWTIQFNVVQLYTLRISQCTMQFNVEQLYTLRISQLRCNSMLYNRTLWESVSVRDRSRNFSLGCAPEWLPPRLLFPGFRIFFRTWFFSFRCCKIGKKCFRIFFVFITRWCSWLIASRTQDFCFQVSEYFKLPICYCGVVPLWYLSFGVVNQ